MDRFEQEMNFYTKWNQRTWVINQQIILHLYIYYEIWVRLFLATNSEVFIIKPTGRPVENDDGRARDNRRTSEKTNSETQVCTRQSRKRTLDKRGQRPRTYGATVSVDRVVQDDVPTANRNASRLTVHQGHRPGPAGQRTRRVGTGKRLTAEHLTHERGLLGRGRVRRRPARNNPWAHLPPRDKGETRRRCRWRCGVSVVFYVSS